MPKRARPPADISALLGFADEIEDVTPDPLPPSAPAMQAPTLEEARQQIYAQQRSPEQTAGQQSPNPDDPAEPPQPQPLPPTNPPDNPDPEEDAEDDRENREWNPDNPRPARAPRNDDDPDDPTKDPLRPEDEPDVVPGQPGPGGRRAADDPTIVDPLDGDITPPPKESYAPQASRTQFGEAGTHQSTQYESRVRILEAFQYPGRLPPDAPEWIDRNWIGWADFDAMRGIEAGPCLRVPTQTGEIAICRPGDYVTRQEMLLMVGFPGDIKVEVWPQSTFEKLFMPTKVAGNAGDVGASTSIRPLTPSKLGAYSLSA